MQVRAARRAVPRERRHPQREDDAGHPLDRHEQREQAIGPAIDVVVVREQIAGASADRAVPERCGAGISRPWRRGGSRRRWCRVSGLAVREQRDERQLAGVLAGVTARAPVMPPLKSACRACRRGTSGRRSPRQIAAPRRPVIADDRHVAKGGCALPQVGLFPARVDGGGLEGTTRRFRMGLRARRDFFEFVQAGARAGALRCATNTSVGASADSVSALSRTASDPGRSPPRQAGSRMPKAHRAGHDTTQPSETRGDEETHGRGRYYVHFYGASRDQQDTTRLSRVSLFNLKRCRSPARSYSALQ